MKVAHRLYLTSVPAILGVFAVAALAYWGQYARTVPETVLIVAAVAAIATLILAWINVRHVAQRVERIASGRQFASVSAPDELDAIEAVVTRLGTAAEHAELTRAEREQRFEQRARDYAQSLAILAAGATLRLDDVRLPLHILLDNHFGELNENQEELLGAVKTAAEAVDADLTALRDIAELDLGTRIMRRDRVLPVDMVRAILPTLQATAEGAGAILRPTLEPLTRPVWVDQAALQEALSTIFCMSLSSTQDGAAVTLTLELQPSGVCIELRGAGDAPATIRLARATRFIEANNATVRRDAGSVTILIAS